MFQELDKLQDRHAARLPAPGASPEQTELWREIVSTLWRRRRWLLVGAALGVIAALTFLRVAPARYVAVAQLLIDPTDLRVVDNAVTSNNTPGDPTVALVESQVRVPASQTVP